MLLNSPVLHDFSILHAPASILNLQKKLNYNCLPAYPFFLHFQCWLMELCLTYHPTLQLWFAVFSFFFFTFVSVWFLFLLCSACITFFVSLCRLWADIILWKGNDPTVLRLCMCAVWCNGLAFYCLPHTNLATEGMRWHLQGTVYERQPHMKEWPLKMIKEITALGCTTPPSRLASCTSFCPNTHMHTHT